VKQPLDFPALFPEVQMLAEAELRRGVEAVWQRLWQESPFAEVIDVPTAQDIPYPHVVHNRAVLAMALAVSEIFQRFHHVQVDQDLLIAAALLQDASKLVEFRPTESGTVYSEIGRNLPHGFMAAHLAMEEGLPPGVCEVIMSHSPTATRFPERLEGKILYYVDQLDVIAVFGDRWRKEVHITK
jgi:hypothetical protein